MARITRSSVLSWFQKLLGLQAGSDKIPVELNDKIQAVVDINPKISTICKSALQTSSTAYTLYTTPVDKDFYLTTLSLGVSKDAANDNTNCYISIVVSGETILFNPIDSQTTTAGSYFKETSFSYPLLLERGSLIRIAGTFAAGTMAKRGTLTGFILE